MVGHLNSGTTIPASKIYNDCGIPQIIAVGDEPQIHAARASRPTFRIVANDNALGAGLALLCGRQAAS